MYLSITIQAYPPAIVTSITDEIIELSFNTIPINTTGTDTGTGTNNRNNSNNSNKRYFTWTPMERVVKYGNFYILQMMENLITTWSVTRIASSHWKQ